MPSASSLGVEVIDVYRAVFTSLGAREVVALRPESRAEAADPDLVDELGKVERVFLTGGNQLKLSAFITGTPFGDAIAEAYQRGAVVGGTSAGASILAEHMIAFGSGGSTPKQRMSQLSAGLGLLRGVVIDQHFEQRNRYGRLLSLVAQSPSLLGMGVDEDTAAVVREGHLLEVVGRGAVTLIDGRHLVSNAFAAQRTAPLLVSGAVLHVLPAGSRFDLATRALVAHQTAGARLRGASRPAPPRRICADWPRILPRKACRPPTTPGTSAAAGATAANTRRALAGRAQHLVVDRWQHLRRFRATSSSRPGSIPSRP